MKLISFAVLGLLVSLAAAQEEAVKPPRPPDDPEIARPKRENTDKKTADPKAEEKAELEKAKAKLKEWLTQHGFKLIAGDAPFACKDVSFSGRPVLGHRKLIGLMANLGDSLKIAGFSVIMTDKKGKLIATGKFVIAGFKRGGIKSFEVLTEVDAADVENIAIQFDSGFYGE